MATGVGEVRMGEAEKRGGKGGSREKKGGKGKEEETEKGRSSGSKEGSRGVGDMGRRRGSGEVRSRGEEVGAGEVPQMDKDVWEEAVGKDAYKKVVGSCDRCERGVCTKEGEGVPTIKGRKRRGERICEGTVAEGLHSAIEITANGAGVLCREEGWEEEDGARLQIS